MRWCNVQTNEYDLQAKTFPIICTHHKLCNNNEKKSQFFRNVYAISDRILRKHLRPTTTEKYDNNWKGGYCRFDYDNSMSHVFNACEQSCIMLMMGGNKMFKTEYDLKAILNSAYDTLKNVQWGN